MHKFRCPHCGATLKARSQHFGRRVLCKSCDQQIVVPTPTTESSDPHDRLEAVNVAKHPNQNRAENCDAIHEDAQEPSEVPSMVEGSLDSASVRNRGPQRISKGVLAFANWEFDRYHTPWIIRVSWLVVLPLALLWMVLLVLTYLFPAAGGISVSGGRAVPDFGNMGNEEFLDSMLDMYSSGGSLLPGVGVQRTGFIGRLMSIASFVTMLALIVLGVLWTRVVLELIFVVFDIQRTLKSIETKESANKPAD